MSFFSNLKSRINNSLARTLPAVKRTNHNVQLQLESLEAREVPNAAFPSMDDSPATSSFAVEDTGSVFIALLVPAVQKVR